MDQQCSEHGSVCKEIQETKDNTQKIIIGLYGSIDNTKQGFVAHVSEELLTIKNTLLNLKDVRGDFVKVGIALITSVLTAAAAIIVAMVDK